MRKGLRMRPFCFAKIGLVYLFGVFMKSFILIGISIFFFANVVNGQTIDKVIDRLIKLELLDKSNKNVMRQFLNRQGDTSNNTVLAGLQYFEMMKLMAKNKAFSNIVTLPILNRDEQDSTNKKLLQYLNAINSAGLIPISIYSECKENIEKGNYQIKYQLLDDITQKSQVFELFGQTTVPLKKKNLLPTKDIEGAVSGWKTIGLLDHLTNEQVESSKNKAIEDSENLNEALSHFPSVIHWFDTELENLNDPYAELLREFSKISHGVFNPTEISDNFRNPIKNKVAIEFMLNEKKYSKEFTIQDDWIDASFITFVKQVVTENRLTGQFYELYEGGQGAFIVFLTPQQYQFIKQNKLLVFAEH